MKWLTAGLLLSLVAGAQSATAQDRGRALHDTHCVACHDSQVYTRADHIARNYAALRAQVERWQQNTSLNWQSADIDQVTSYLAERYYKF